MEKKFPLLFFAFLLSFSCLQAITITSANGGGSWHVAGSWSPAQIPTSADDVIISASNPITVSTYAYAISITIDVGASLSLGASTYITGNLTVNGSFPGSGTVYFIGSGAKTFSGSATITHSGNFNFEGGATTISPGTTINKAGYMHVISPGSLTNNGSVTLTAGTISISGGTSWTQGASSFLRVYSNIYGGGTLNASAADNTVFFGTNCAGPYNPSASTFHHLSILGGAKSLSFNVRVNGNFTNGSATTFNGNLNTMTLLGNWVSSNATINSTTNLHISLEGTSLQTITKPFNFESFQNFTVNSTSTVQLGNSIYVLGILTLNAGTLDVSTFNYTVFVGGDWVNNGGSFNPRNGAVRFADSGAQSLTRLSGTELFYDVFKTGTGTLTLNSNISVGRDMIISAGTLAIAVSQTITLTRNWSNTGGTFSPGTGTVLTSGAAAQSITKTASTETFHHFTKGTANTVTLGSHISCSGNLFVAAGTLNCTASNFNITVGGNVTFNGTVSNNSNTWTLNGSAGQTVSGTVNQTFFNLTVNNTGAGITHSAGQHRITSTYTPTAGNWATSGVANLTWLSGAATTAIIASGAGTFSGTGYTLQRFISSRAANWHDFGTPVAATTLLDWDNEIYMSGVGGADGNACCPVFQSVLTYDETAGAYVDVTTVSYTLNPGEGYTIWLGDDLTNWSGTSVIDSRNTPNMGTQSFPLSYTGASADPGGHLIGNPHAATLDWTSILAASTNLDATFYMFDNGGNYLPFGGGDVIPPHQGFFVYTDVGGGTIAMPQSVKTSSTSSTFNRVARPYDLSLSFTSPVTKFSHEIFVNLDENATMNYDNGLDARFVKSPEPNAPNLTMALNSDRLLIRNAFAPIEDVVIIPVRAKVGVSGNYTITAKNAAGINDYTCVLLKDLVTGEVTDLKSTASYSFDIKSTDDPNRFVLYMIRNQEECEDVLARPAPPSYFNENMVSVLNDGQSVYVKFDMDKTSSAVIGVYDAVGQLVSESGQYVSAGKVKVEMPETNGIYIVKITVNGQTISRKVVMSK